MADALNFSLSDLLHSPDFPTDPTTQTRVKTQYLKDFGLQMLDAAATKVGLPPVLVQGVKQAESGKSWDANLRSKVSAVGPMQLMPGTAKELGVNPLDVEQNIQGGTQYLKQMMDMFDGDVNKSLAAYNWGPGNVQATVKKYGDQWPDHVPDETKNYLTKITGLLRNGASTQAAPEPAPSSAPPFTLSDLLASPDYHALTPQGQESVRQKYLLEYPSAESAPFTLQDLTSSKDYHALSPEAKDQVQQKYLDEYPPPPASPLAPFSARLEIPQPATAGGIGALLGAAPQAASEIAPALVGPPVPQPDTSAMPYQHPLLRNHVQLTPQDPGMIGPPQPHVTRGLISDILTALPRAATGLGKTLGNVGQTGIDVLTSGTPTDVRAAATGGLLPEEYPLPAEVAQQAKAQEAVRAKLKQPIENVVQEVQSFEQHNPTWFAPSKEEQESWVRKALVRGPESAAQSLAIGVPALMTGGLPALVLSGGTLFSMAEWQEAEKDIQAFNKSAPPEKQIPSDVATQVKLIRALAEGGGEMVSNFVGGKILGLDTFFKGAGKEALTKVLTPSLRKTLGQVGGVAVSETIPEMGTSATQAAANRMAGIPGPSPTEAAIEAGPQALVASLIFAGVGLAAQRPGQRRVYEALSNPQTEQAQRMDAARVVSDAIKAETKNPDLAKNFLEAAQATIQRGKALPLDLTAQETAKQEQGKQRAGLLGALRGRGQQVEAPPQQEAPEVTPSPAVEALPPVQQEPQPPSESEEFTLGGGNVPAPPPIVPRKEEKPANALVPAVRPQVPQAQPPSLGEGDYQAAQDAIDARLDELVAQGKTEDEADQDPSLIPLYEKRDAIGQAQLEQSHQELMQAVTKKGVDPQVARGVLKEVYAVDPTVGVFGHYQAGEYTQRLVKERVRNRERILNKLLYNPDETGLSNATRIASGAYTRGFEDTLRQHARDIEQAVYEYFHGPEVEAGTTPPPVPPPKGLPAPQAITPETIHQLADEQKVKWDDDQAFMDFSKEKTGVAELDKMSQDQLQTIKVALERGEKPQPAQQETKPAPTSVTPPEIGTPEETKPETKEEPLTIEAPTTTPSPVEPAQSQVGEVAPSPARWFHASHSDIRTLSPRTVESIDSVGTWATGNEAHARSLYGPKVHAVKHVPRNLLEAHTDDFDEFFFSNVQLFQEQFPGESLNTLDQFTTKGLQQKDRRAYTMRTTYLRAFRKMLEEAGYDGVLWKNSRIDLRPGDDRHDVAVFFHENPLEVDVPQAEAPTQPEPAPSQDSLRTLAAGVASGRDGLMPKDRAAMREALGPDTLVDGKPVKSLGDKALARAYGARGKTPSHEQYFNDVLKPKLNENSKLYVKRMGFVESAKKDVERLRNLVKVNPKAASALQKAEGYLATEQQRFNEVRAKSNEEEKKIFDDIPAEFKRYFVWREATGINTNFEQKEPTNANRIQSSKALPAQPGTRDRETLGKGDTAQQEAAGAGEAQAEEVVPSPTQGPPEIAPETKTVTTRIAANRRDASPQELAADYKARGIERQAVYSEFVKDQGLRPEIDAKRFFAIYDSALARRLPDQEQSVSFSPTHYDTLKKQNVQVTPSDTGNSLLWDDGTTGHDPGPLAERYIPRAKATPAVTPPPPPVTQAAPPEMPTPPPIAPPTPQPEQPAAYGTKNTVFTSEAADKARARLKKKLSQVNVGLDPEIMADGLTLAGYHIEAGARSFAAYSKAILADLGEVARPYLRGWYENVRYYPGFDTTGMSTADEIAALETEGVQSSQEAPADVEPTAKRRPARQGTPGPRSEDVPGTATGEQTAIIRGGESERSPRDAGSLPGQGVDESLQEDGPNVPGISTGIEHGEPSGPGASDSGGGRSLATGRGAGSGNYVIAPGGLAREGSWRDAATRNLDIIELVKRLESENRPTTPDEQALLIKYVGFGAADIRNNLFPTRSYARPVWQDLADRAAALLTDAERTTLLRSTQYAHYTSEAVIRSIYAGLERMGFTGGKVLEPGAGIGHFAGLMPTDMANVSTYTGIEFDHLTAAIAKALYPGDTILRQDYTTAKLPNDFFDAAIGNPPFASTRILTDPAYRKQRFMLHDYFFAKTIDKVRPGGLLVFVTSKGTMDKIDDKARKYLADRADLLGAVRLPQTAFQANAGTEVVTDVLFLRKREPGTPQAGEAWQGKATVPTLEGDTEVNEYFAVHPEMVLGTHSLTGTMRAAENEYTVLPREGEDIETAFRQAIQRLPENIYSPLRSAPDQVVATTIARDFNPKIRKEGGLYVADNGTLMVLDKGSGIPLTNKGKPLSQKDIPWLKDYVGLRDAIKTAQMDQLHDGDWEGSLKALNKAYTAFVKKHGPVQDFTLVEHKELTDDGEEKITVEHRYKNKQRLKYDVESPLVFALERITEDNKIVKGPFLAGRSLKRPTRPEITSPQDAMAVVLDEHGTLDLPKIAQLMNSTTEQVIEELGDLIYQSPSGEWQTADEYLSGFVKAKLAEAEIAAKSDRRYERNVNALSTVQPKPLAPRDITVHLGASWVAPQYVEEFTADVLGENTSVAYNSDVNLWSLGAGRNQRHRGAGQDWGTLHRSPTEILDAVLNSRVIKIQVTQGSGANKETVTLVDETAAANEIAKKMKVEFQSWIWKDADRAKDLTDLYNEKFNNIVPRSFDGSHLSLPGASLLFKLYPHQKRAIWRIIQTGNTYLAHSVGSGKTFEMIAAGMEQKRLGMIRKPMYVVPRHMLSQFASEFLELYPSANIMVADEEAFHTDNRRQFVARAALNDPDAIIFTQPAFQLLSMKPENYQRVVDEFIDELRDALADVPKDERATRSRLESQIEQLEQRVAAKYTANRDKVVDFEDMGADFVFVDEFQNYRKLDFSTNRQAKGITPAGSARAIDMYAKTRWLESQRPGRSFVAASGTPVTNTMAELYTLQKFFSYPEMKNEDLGAFDAWANQYGDVESKLEMNAAGNYGMVERFSKFTNLPELRKRIGQFMDILTFNQLKGLLTIPTIKGGEREVVIVPRSEALIAYQQTLAARIQAIKMRTGPPSPGDDIMLSVITDGRLANIDMRYVDPQADNDPQNKLNTMADNIIEVYHRTKDTEYVGAEDKADAIKGSAQIVFSVSGFGEQVTQSRGFDGRAWLMKRLKDGGIPAREIGWITDYKNASQKAELFADMRSGKKKIMIGSPMNMGTGVNAQKRLKALHFLDPPWFPADVEQPEGRILRQKNQNPEAELYAYAVKASYDATMWGLIARKSRFIEQFFSGDDSLRTMEDLSETSQYEMASALASGDQRVIQLAGLNGDIERLTRLRNAHEQDQRQLGSDLSHHGRHIEWHQQKKKNYEEAVEKSPLILARSFTASTGTRTFDNREEFGEALVAAAKKIYPDLEKEALANSKKDGEAFRVIGKLDGRHGIALVHNVRNGTSFFLHITPHVSEQWNATPLLLGEGSPTGLVTKLVNYVNSLERQKDEIGDEIETAQRRIADIRSKIGAPFAYEQELFEKIAQAAQLTNELSSTEETAPDVTPFAEIDFTSPYLFAEHPEDLNFSYDDVLSHAPIPAPDVGAFAATDFGSPSLLANQRGAVATDILAAPVRIAGQAARRVAGNRRIEMEAMLGEGRGEKAYDEMQWAHARAETQIADVIETIGELHTHENMWRVLSRVFGKRSAAEVSRFFRSSRIGQQFGVPASRQDALFDAAESIKTFNGTDPEFGTRIFEKDPDTNELIRDASGEPVMKEWRYTPEQGEQFWADLNDREKAAVKHWVELRDVVKEVFNVSGEIEGYVHHFWDRGFFEGVGTIMGRHVRLKKKKAGARIGRQAEEGQGFVRDFERSVIKVQADLIKEDEWNKMIARLTPLVTKPIGPEGVLPGWKKIEKLASTRRAKFIGQIGGGRQIPEELYNEMIVWGDRLRDATMTASAARSIGSYFTANLLMFPGTFANNIVGSGMQYATLVTDTTAKAMMTGQVRPLMDTLTAPFRALLPSVWQTYTPEILGSHSNIITQFENRSAVDTAFSTILGATMGAVDNYVKRAVAVAVSRSLGLPMSQKDILANTQAYSEMRKLVNTFGLDYANVNSRLAQFRQSPYSRWVSPFVTYGYKIMEMMGHYLAALSPGAKMEPDPRFQFDRSLLAKAGLTPEQIERISRLMTLGAIFSLLALLFPEDEEKTGKQLPGMPMSLDRTGMVKVGEKPGDVEQWWSPGGQPWFPLFMTARAANRWYQRGESPTDEILTALGTYSPSGGPLVQGMMAGRDYLKDPQRYPLGPSLARAVKPLVPFGRIAEGTRRMEGGPEVKSRTFTQELAEAAPFPVPDEWIGARKIVKDPITGNPILRDPTMEQLKFWLGIRLKDIDPFLYRYKKEGMLQNTIDALDRAETIEERDRAIARLKELDPAWGARAEEALSADRLLLEKQDWALIEAMKRRQREEKVPAPPPLVSAPPDRVPAPPWMEEARP